MLYPLTITGSAMREINRAAILEIIRREGPISRTIIAERLEVSLPTVVRIVDLLMDEGFVRLAGGKEWSGGRRRPLLEFNGDSYLVLGVDMSGTQMFGAISDLGGNVIEEMILSPHGLQAEENYTQLTGLIDRLLASPRLGGRQVRGIGVGAPGITLHKDGIVKWAYALRWDRFPLKTRLAERYALPITVDNDVNLAALGELWFGAGQSARNMIMIALSDGIGAGIIIERALYRGSNEASGEIGNMLTSRSQLGQNYQEFGALETAASGTGILVKARKALQSRRTAQELQSLTADEVFLAARSGEKWALRIFNETCDELAITIANLTVSFDPDLIVLGGELTNVAGMLLEPIMARLRGAIPAPPRLVVSRLGLRATVMGAITNVLHNTENFYVVYKLT